MMVRSFAEELARYRAVAERAIAQIPDSALNTVVAPDGNSAAMIVRHVSVNLVSRFTDFLTTDGEKPWRRRDEEFEMLEYSRAQVEELWRKGWDVLESQLGALGDADLSREVAIRGQPLTVHQALCRATAHVAYHVGQIVLLARMLATAEWRWISIPKGQSETYDRNPTLEKGPR